MQYSHFIFIEGLIQVWFVRFDMGIDFQKVVYSCDNFRQGIPKGIGEDIAGIAK